VSANDMDPISGFIYILTRGNALFISRTMSTYYLSLKQVTDYGLRTGDFVEGKTDGRTISEILSVKHTAFDNAKCERPYNPSSIENIPFKLGDKVILAGDKPMDFISYIGNHGSKIDKTYKIALLIDQGEDCIDYLVSTGIDEVYLAGIKQSLKSKVLFALTSSIVAKHHASNGKNVVLFIDNLNKLFKLYNSSMADNEGAIDVTKLQHGALVDLKEFFAQARQLTNGSLTIISYLRKPTTELEKYVMDDFIDLSSVYKEII